MGAAESTPTPAGLSLPQRSMYEIKNQKSDPKLSMVAVGTIDNASALVIQEGNKLAKLYEEVGKMNGWNLFWDSKVPDKDKWTYFGLIPFNPIPSNPDEIRREIKRYYDFYASMRTVLKNVRSGEDEGLDRIDEIVDELYEELEEMSRIAESDLESTNSRTIQVLHKDFKTKHEKLENMIRKVETVGLRQKQKILTEKWEEAMRIIEELTGELRTATTEKVNLKNLIMEMRKENEKSKREREQLLKENRQILTLLQKFTLNRV